MASNTSTKRLLKEYQSTQRELGLSPAHPHRSPSANPDLLELRPWDVEGEDLSEWTAVIRGPPSGFYSSGVFSLSIAIPSNYPTKPPSFKFKTKIFHPNVSWKDGEICLDILQAQWTPAWTLSSACTAILALLDDPEPDSPLNVDAATLYRTGDRRAYASMCRMYTLLYAQNHLLED
ncbi:probable ubiquitin-conjugating enzyme E2 [Ustilago trichophora]|uniref:Probable ubiquitin-conjugating enzyme E2 n=1 Tax=Ustilago trichophora TaxID=86804 RepID=A0A5C3DS31_9BASI|nr:probable ubiquitin-conjugating enzyme E2 [Ustilago trichophora]